MEAGLNSLDHLVTNGSFRIILSWLMSKQNAKAPFLRQPLSKSQMGDASQLRALIVASRDRIMTSYPIDESLMNNFIQ